MLKESKTEIIETCKKWVETFIIGLNLCPFAKAFYIKNQVRFSVIDNPNNSTKYFEDFGVELDLLEADINKKIETTLLIIPAFGDMKHFLMYEKLCNEMLEINDLTDKYLLVPFHPYLRIVEYKNHWRGDLYNIYPNTHLLWRLPLICNDGP